MLVDHENKIRDELGHSSVHTVKQEVRNNSDGEPILWVEIVLAHGVELTGRQMADLTDILWQSVLDKDGTAFPVIDFIAQEDLEEVAAA